MRYLRCIILTSVLAASPAAAELEIRQLPEDALSTLVDLIRLDTSQPLGNEYLVTDYLKSRLDTEGIASTVIESASGRANIVARLRGNGRKRPLLLLGHTDVVTVEREHWSFDPFSGTVADGKVFGRGAADDKGIVAASFEILLALHRNRVPLDRDVIFLGVADEEGGGKLGITYMVAKQLALIDAEFAINEGGRGYIDPESGAYLSFHIGTAEKTPMRARLLVEGRAGHGSVPTRDNAIGILSRAVGKLFDQPLPMQLNETTRTFFERLALVAGPAEAEVYRGILGDNPGSDVQERLRDINPSYYSIIRTSIVPTIIKGGYQRNVIPSEAEAILDIRALPGVSPESLFPQIAAIIDDPAVRIYPMEITRPEHLPTPLDTVLFRAFEDVLLARHPQAIVLPSMLTGATDSAQLRAAGIPTYGFGPALQVGDDNGIHGNDEFLRVAPYFEYVEQLWLIVNRVAGRDPNQDGGSYLR